MSSATETSNIIELPQKRRNREYPPKPRILPNRILVPSNRTLAPTEVPPTLNLEQMSHQSEYTSTPSEGGSVREAIYISPEGSPTAYSRRSTIQSPNRQSIQIEGSANRYANPRRISMMSQSTVISTRCSSTRYIPLVMEPSLWKWIGPQRTLLHAIFGDDGGTRSNINGNNNNNNSNGSNSYKVLGISLEGTMVVTKSGQIFSRDREDWKFFGGGEKSLAKIRKYVTNGYKLVVFANHRGLASQKVDTDEYKAKVEDISEELGVPFLFYAATGIDEFRKPNIGMWEYFIEYCNEQNIAIDIADSIYIGSMAGRYKTPTLRKDHNASDYKFALNIGMKFKTPEMFFLKTEEKLPPIDFDPRKLPSEGPLFQGHEDYAHNPANTYREIVLSGGPSSGKTTFVRNYLSAYLRISQEKLTNKQFIKRIKGYLLNGQKVVIDDVNETCIGRKQFIHIAVTFNVPIRCFFFIVSQSLCKHLNYQKRVNRHRRHYSKPSELQEIIKYFTKVEMPNPTEGFDRVMIVNFVANFKNDQDATIFRRFTA